MSFSEEYYLRVSGEQKGPYTIVEIQQLFLKGFIAEETLYWGEGMDHWQFVTDFCGDSQKKLRKVRPARWSLRVVIGAIAATALIYLYPIVHAGWKEAYEKEFNAEAAYWKARGLVRDRLKPQKVTVSFDSFDSSAAAAANSSGHVTLRGTVFTESGRSYQAGWQVELFFRDATKEWLLTSVRPVESTSPESTVAPQGSKPEP
ncbi:MAG: domain 2 [Chthoniobacter sp.]|jgi:hypothetical protein|nr:domain 2 [Chthoniobacter sp.]